MTRRRSEGMTLLECLMYVACLSIAANVLIPAFTDATRLSAYGNAAAERLGVVSDFRANLTRTVHEATRVIESAGIYFTGNDQLVLELPPDDSGMKQYAVVGKVPEAPKLQCLRLHEENGVLVPDQCLVYPLQTTELQFTHVRTLEGVTLVTLNLRVMNIAGKKDKPPVLYRFDSATRTAGMGS